MVEVIVRWLLVFIFLTSPAFAEEAPKRTPFVVPLFSLHNCGWPRTAYECAKAFCEALGYKNYFSNEEFAGDRDGKVVQGNSVNWIRNLTCYD
ncbi:hypothetical protein [Bradyrhizobium guangzhouense]|uniref:hypothetical protein n=1 Tax=Bradyrhizobium guangzhouense TaxID=1325095 RepID=UPI0010261F0C|nr:hypothetical protein [Bradyrhizobium guangzhouense]RXH09496.1 hypothetical protein EAS54_33405 [Bradyrhizobium guangzhouense]